MKVERAIFLVVVTACVIADGEMVRKWMGKEFETAKPLLMVQLLRWPKSIKETNEVVT